MKSNSPVVSTSSSNIFDILKDREKRSVRTEMWSSHEMPANILFEKLEDRQTQVLSFFADGSLYETWAVENDDAQAVRDELWEDGFRPYSMKNGQIVSIGREELN